MAKSFSRQVRTAVVSVGLLWLIACGTAADHSSRTEPIATASEALSGPVTYNINVTLPTGTSIVDTTVGSAGAIAFGPGDTILGPTGSGAGTVEVAGLATASAITASANVQVDASAVVNGNVQAGGLIFVLPFGQVNGTQTALSSTTKPYTTTWSVTNPGNSQGPIALTNNAIASPSPGVYDTVSVNPGSSVYLHSGTYFFQSLDLEPGANLYVDSSNGPVFLYVTTTLEFRGNEKSLDASVPQFFLGFLGTCEVDLESPFNGVFVAPNATLVHMADPLWVTDPVKKAAGNAATIYGNWVIVDPGELITPSDFDWSTVPGFPTPPGGWAANGGTTGTGTPGSGSTGGTGGGGGKTTAGTLPPAAVSFHLSTQPPGASPPAPPAFTPTSASTISPSSQVPFHVPASFDVGGVIANGTVTLTYTSCTGASVTCTYQGGSSSANPTTPEDLEAGRTVTLLSCSDGQPAIALRCGTSFSLSSSGGPAGWPLSVDLALDDRACSTKVDLLTPGQTRKMLDSFQWPDPTLKTPPLVAETSADGQTPMLYYAWVYLHDTKDLLRLRQMYIHILSRPLYTQELEPYAGQCVVFQNPGDGVGTFVPVVIPGKVYNTLLNVQNHAFDDAQSPPIQKDQAPLFKAVILRTTTPIDFPTLKNSGFRFLDYEHGPIAQNAMQLQAGAATEVLQSVFTFALQAVQGVQKFVTDALGDLDAIFASRITYNMTINVDNSGAAFSQPYAIRAWGRSAGRPLGAGGLKVTLFENLFGLIPETFSGYTNDSGIVSIRPAKHSSSDIGGAGFCVTLQNSAIWATSFLLPNDVCNLQGFDRLQVGLATSVSSNPINVPDFFQFQQFEVVMSNSQLATVYQATDAYRYMQDVVGTPIATAHALVGDPANLIGWFNGGRASTFGLHLRNGGSGTEQEIQTLMTPYIRSFVTSAYANGIDQISTGGSIVVGTVLGPASIAVVWLASVFTNNDIVFPDKATDSSGTGAREVGSHEFGHFILLDLMHERDSAAIDNLIGDSLASGRGDDYSYPTRYINEAFADYITGQVTGIANYHWLSNKQGDGDKICIHLPCFDENFNSMPTSGTDTAAIARISTLIHDVFDGQPLESNRNQNQPDNADPWAQTNSTTGPFSYTAFPWGDGDGPDSVNGLVPACRVGTGPQLATVSGVNPLACVASESVALSGKAVIDFANNLADLSSGSTPYLTDQHVFGALDRAMITAGYNWCQRCQVMALHVSENGDPEGTGDKLNGTCQRE